MKPCRDRDADGAHPVEAEKFLAWVERAALLPWLTSPVAWTSIVLMLSILGLYHELR